MSELDIKEANKLHRKYWKKLTKEKIVCWASGHKKHEYENGQSFCDRCKMFISLKL